MARTPTSIVGADGKRRDGYIDNGRTYYSSGKRIESGATVTDNSGREWRMTDKGGVATGNNYSPSGNQGAYRDSGGGSGRGSGGRNIGGATPATDYYSRYLEQQQAALRESQRAAEEATRQRTQAAVNTNNAYIPQVNQQTDKQLQEAYISREQAKGSAPQSLAAMGYTGGTTESSLIELDTNYQNQRNTLETSRNTSLDQIRQNAQQIQSTGNANMADLAANYYNQMAAAQQQAASAAQQQSNWQAQFDAQQQAQSREDYASTANAYYQNYQAQINRLKAQGYTDDDYEVRVLNSLRNQKMQQEQQLGPQMTPHTALRYYNQGLLSKEDLMNMGYSF